MSRDLFRLKNKTLKTLKIFIINALFSNYIMLGQDWASMSYIVNDDDTIIFSGVFKSTSQESIVLELDCKGKSYINKMTSNELIKSMELLGWELSEHIQLKDKKGKHVVWFRRYE
tara:strand:+ start:2846 stop:3190 length:345 start_codon:yes stop_codon:yes gene_type:complete